MIRIGDARDLARAGHGPWDCIVTSPPYWGLRSYLDDDHPDKALEIGTEPNLEDYVRGLVELFRDLREGLADDGTVWLNLGDCYAGSGRGGGGKHGEPSRQGRTFRRNQGWRSAPSGLKPKDLCLVPYRVAIAMVDDAWYLRSNIVWAKPNPMPESVKDRPTTSHEAVFLFSKSARYHFDADAIAEKARGATSGNGFERPGQLKREGRGARAPWKASTLRHPRNVWTLPTQPYAGAHHAVMPPGLAERCVLAGCRPGGVVLDPFGGSGTTAMVAARNGRRSEVWDIDERNKALIQKRTRQQGLLLPGSTGGRDA